MKHIVTLLCLLLTFSTGTAQDWELINPYSGLLSVDKAEDERKFYIDIVNNGADTLSLLAYRTENVLAEGNDTTHLTYFCWDLCYGVNGAQSIDPVKISPGDTLNHTGVGDGQYIAFIPGNIDGYSRTTMRIVNANDPEDFLDIVYEFSVGGATNSIKDAKLASQSLSNPMPNPARDRFSVDVELPSSNNGTLRLFNLIGKEVLRQEVNIPSSTANMEVSSLPRGVYFLHLVSEGQAISSRRVILQ